MDLSPLYNAKFQSCLIVSFRDWKFMPSLSIPVGPCPHRPLADTLRTSTRPSCNDGGLRCVYHPCLNDVAQTHRGFFAFRTCQLNWPSFFRNRDSRRIRHFLSKPQSRMKHVGHFFNHGSQVLLLSLPGSDDEGFDRGSGEMGRGAKTRSLWWTRTCPDEKMEDMLIRTRTGRHKLPFEKKCKIL